MNPITRYEMYLANMNGESIDIPEPITRVEMYLARLCGMNNDIPKPITREEMFLAYLCGEEITPPEAITRLEMFMASAAGIGDKPTPITRKEMFWNGVEAVEDVTVSGNPLTFATDISRALKKAEVAFSPVQDLHGYDHPWPAGGGKNKFNGTFLQGYWAYADGTWVNSLNWVTTEKIPCKPSTYYTASADNRQTRWQGFVYYDNNGDFISTQNLNNKLPIGYTVKTPANAAYLIFNIAGKSEAYDTISPSDVTHFQIEEGQTATSYAPYSNICPISGWTRANVYHSGADTSDATTYSITFPSEAGTVCGGTLDVTTGKLTVTHGNIASYSGETLPGRWISSMDVYSAGGTPTTGAQVVYELATPIEYDIDAVEIKSLYGDNVMWSDGDNLEVTYVKKATT